jgi:hypothetical protein
MMLLKEYSLSESGKNLFSYKSFWRMRQMNARIKSVAAAVTLAVVSSSTYAVGEAPIGWSQITGASTSNVKFYKKNGSDVYAQVVYMSGAGGAKVEMKQIYTSTVNGFKRYQRNSISSWFSGANNPVSVINGDYFNGTLSPNTTLSFAVRANGTLVEVGGDPTNDLQIEFFTGQGAFVTGANAWRMSNGTSAQNAVGGFSPNLAIKKTELIGRMGLCTLSLSNPSPYFLILAHKNATQNSANADFASWKCNTGSIIMMDGSASAQMAYKENGVSKIIYGLDSAGGQNRTVPQVLVIRNN